MFFVLKNSFHNGIIIIFFAKLEKNNKFAGQYGQFFFEFK